MNIFGLLYNFRSKACAQETPDHCPMDLDGLTALNDT